MWCNSCRVHPSMQSERLEKKVQTYKGQKVALNDVVMANMSGGGFKGLCGVFTYLYINISHRTKEKFLKFPLFFTILLNEKIQQKMEGENLQYIHSELLLYIPNFLKAFSKMKVLLK